MSDRPGRLRAEEDGSVIGRNPDLADVVVAGDLERLCRPVDLFFPPARPGPPDPGIDILAGKVGDNDAAFGRRGAFGSGRKASIPSRRGKAST